ncbi:putative thiamine transport system ATP-binding protein [Modicisalibacter muralis]|uniref:Putative thiamine transport system ATP-binding protein n=1 Tax=Modicisalibacter muralis TaxID=119000 RepID=A0A1G9I1Q8_9GAMM|nr:ATP-binding cassette domain-containing protein [Halomonas muralis]SDL18976.1 putative thiamine transport system ATP-binding protein [Halomonas muralis]
MLPLALEGIHITLDGAPLLSVDTVIAPGEVLTVMGPSGVGKSTLLAYIAGFLSPAFVASGHVRLGDRELTRLPAEERRVGLLFQDPLLFPHLSVDGNLAFGMSAVGSRRERQQRSEAALADVGLEGYRHRDPATLSGGQKARVALLRVLLSEPGAMLLDEPFSKLDATLRDEMRALVFARVRERGLPTLMVTHDAADAEAAAGRVIELGQ